MTTTTDTIAAIATAHGIGSIAIIRLSGSEALEIAKKVTKKDTLKPRYAHLCDLYSHDNSLIDQAIVLYFQAPNSFTGEDIVEFQCHGGVVVAQLILEELLHHGARLAEAGEFSKRAFLNGKIDLSEAEAIAKLIEAKSEDAAKILAKQIKGELREYIESVRDEIIHLLAYSEVSIDYAEEDLPEDLVEQIKQKLTSLRKNLQKTLTSSKMRQGLMQGFKVAIVGKPNVGKSSLLNALLSYERAIVSDIAGTTRDTIEEQLRIGSHLVRIVDTAGIRHDTSDKIEQIGIERSVEAIEQSDIVLALFDASREFDEEDAKIVALLEQYRDQKEILYIKNKIDLEQKLRCNCSFDVEIEAKGDLSKLIQKIQAILDKNNSSDEVMLISTRQIEAIKEVIDAIDEAVMPLEDGELELFSFWLNSAVKALNSITRPFDNDEMLDKMFGSFCLGK